MTRSRIRATAVAAVCGLAVAATPLFAATAKKPKPKPKPVLSDISVTQVSSHVVASVGQPMYYEVTAVNNGPQVPKTVTLRDRIPASAGFVSVAGSTGASCTGPRVGLSGTVTCTWSKPAVGAPLMARITVQPNMETALTNTARVTTSAKDGVAANNVSVLTIGAIPYAVTQGGHRCTIVGTPGDDVINGTPGDDVICGLAGNDVIRGLEGNDIIDGGSGNDLLIGGSGNDRIYGGTGANRLYGGTGSDILIGGPGKEFIWGGLGFDVAKISPGDRLLSVERRIR